MLKSLSEVEAKSRKEREACAVACARGHGGQLEGSNGQSCSNGIAHPQQEERTVREGVGGREP